LGKNHGSQPSSFDERLYYGILLLFSLTIFFTRLGPGGMANFDDCFYAEKAKEILQNHQWWILTFDHSPAFENPPLYMWLTALSYKLFGISVYAAKFPSALMGLLNVLLIYSLGRYLFNPWVGRFAAFILATTDPFFKYSRHAMVDVTLTFFIVSALYCLLLALRKNRLYFIFWGLSIALGVLTKSVLGLFPLLISGLFILATAQWKKIANGHFLAGCLVAAVLGGSWYAVEYASYGHDFLKTHFGWLIFQRGFQSQGEPWYHHLSYLKDLAVFDWPWLPLQILGLVFMFRDGRWKSDNVLLILLWIGAVIGVMSCMQTGVLWYIMPSFPALAIAAAWALDYFLDETNKVKVGRGLMGIGLATVVLLNALPIPLNKEREKDVRTIAPYVKYLAGEGASLVALREEYYGLNNALMFFSDHAAKPTLNDPRDLEPLFESPKLVLCVAHRGDLDELSVDLKQWYPVKFGEDLILIANQKIDISDIPTGNGPWND
jgi:4-amino-4-deoxy-L-arabinose transferase-like glycosyltransferase